MRFYERLRTVCGYVHTEIEQAVALSPNVFRLFKSRSVYELRVALGGLHATHIPSQPHKPAHHQPQITSLNPDQPCSRIHPVLQACNSGNTREAVYTSPEKPVHGEGRVFARRCRVSAVRRCTRCFAGTRTALRVQRTATRPLANSTTHAIMSGPPR